MKKRHKKKFKKPNRNYEVKGIRRLTQKVSSKYVIVRLETR